MKFSFTAKNEPECKSFLEIRMPDGEYQPIDEFIKAQPAISEADLEAFNAVREVFSLHTVF